MFFISAICHGQWYFTSNVLQKLCLFFLGFFHNHVSQAAVLSLSFENDVRFLDIL